MSAIIIIYSAAEHRESDSFTSLLINNDVPVAMTTLINFTVNTRTQMCGDVISISLIEGTHKKELRCRHHKIIFLGK